MAKYKEPMGVKKAAKAAKRKASPSKAEFKNAGTLLAKKNRTGKLRFMVDYDAKGSARGATKADKEAGKIIGTRMKSDRTRAASRAKGIAAREEVKAKARRRAKALGN
jgi:hypothetical protein